VIWRTEQIKAEGKPDELAVHADIDIPSRELQMTMSLRRNLDPALPASHVIDLTFRTATDFAGGGVSTVPGIPDQIQRAVARHTAGRTRRHGHRRVFMVGLSNGATDRERNLDLLLQRSWFDIPLVYVSERRAILRSKRVCPVTSRPHLRRGDNIPVRRSPPQASPSTTAAMAARGELRRQVQAGPDRIRYDFRMRLQSVSAAPTVPQQREIAHPQHRPTSAGSPSPQSATRGLAKARAALLPPHTIKRSCGLMVTPPSPSSRIGGF
jgi:hypothetical protein